MVSAVEELAAYRLGLAHGALQRNQSRPDLPVDILPLNLLLVVHVLNETIQVKETISDMLRYNLTMEINEDLGVGAHHPLILFGRIKLPAVDATTEQSAPLILTVTLITVRD